MKLLLIALCILASAATALLVTAVLTAKHRGDNPSLSDVTKVLDVQAWEIDVPSGSTLSVRLIGPNGVLLSSGSGTFLNSPNRLVLRNDVDGWKRICIYGGSSSANFSIRVPGNPSVSAPSGNSIIRPGMLLKKYGDKAASIGQMVSVGEMGLFLYAE